jgi:hypothetical protein
VQLAGFITFMEHPALTPEAALRAYATMLNTLDAGDLEPLLAEDFHYASQWVFDAITSKAAYMGYINAKLQTVRRSGTTVYAEMGTVHAHGALQPCVVLAQGGPEALVGLVLVKVARGCVERIDLVAVPAPQAALRSGVYPGRN